MFTQRVFKNSVEMDLILLIKDYIFMVDFELVSAIFMWSYAFPVLTTILGGKMCRFLS